MADNWNNPTNTTNYDDVLAELRALIHKSANMMQSTASDTNLPTTAIKWDATNNKFQVWSGSAWGDLTTTYAISVSQLNGQVGSWYTNADNLASGTIPAARFNDTSHGVRAGGTLHPVATTSVAGFLSAADKVILDGLYNISDAQVETAYNNQVALGTATDHTTTSTKRWTPKLLSDNIIDRLKGGVKAVIFQSKYAEASANFNVLNGQYQSKTLTANTTFTFTAQTGTPYTMYLYITTAGFTVTLPAGNWSEGTAVAIDTGLCLLTVNYDGSSYFYMASVDMR